MRNFLLSTAAVAVLGGAAYAAEPLPPIAAPPPPVVEPFVVPAWAGPYVGADIGWGWADFDHDGVFIDRHHRFHRQGFFRGSGDDADGVVGGVFAGWLGQTGTFLYGVELFAQLADIDHDRDDFRRFRTDGNIGLGFDGTHGCFLFDVNDLNGVVPADHAHVGCGGFGREVHALFGLEGMIGWGGERTALLLHAGPALGWFKSDHRVVRNAFHPSFPLTTTAVFKDDDDIEFGLSVAAEGRFKLTETIFAGVIGRAFWFPDVGDDNHRFRFGHGDFRHRGDTDVTVFEVKARLGVMFGQPPAAAPLEAAF